MRKGLFGLLLALMLVVVTACGNSTGANGNDEKGTIKIGLNNWPENIAVSHMWKQLLEKEGYTVELTAMEKSPLWVGIADGQLDISPEVWLPTTDAPLYEEYKDKIEFHDAWYEGTGLGLVVPTYMEDVNTIEDLKNAGLTEIVGIDPGSSLMRLTREAMESYGLDGYTLIESSDPAMMSALDKAYKNEEPIVVTLWSPHWAFSNYELKYLEDSQGIYGEPEDINYMTRDGFSEDHEEIVNWMNNWHMDDASLGSLMATINETGDADEGVKQWLEENEELVKEWIK